ncbi:hypothetical protein FRC14_001989 [Serendipita sp. 396]|nr:hypothetical protein FRC14_001989 [Serendipita sp. 396]KAG8785321.1 hypothetical protein FRC15_001594 [Serendipita sp. 397]KAG8801937.1 hypothetical protein FRC16_010767 [Serendipita sp. 398]
MSLPIRSLRLLRGKYALNTTRQALRLSSTPGVVHGINSRRSVMDGGQRPYDPDEDPTPRRKYIFGGALLIAIAAGVLSSIIRDKPARADTWDDKTIGNSKKDPATDVEFPTTLDLPGTPPLTLLGLGVRTVSFLGLKVYSVGFYADLNQPGFIPRLDGTAEERIEYLIRNTTCALRIVPVRSTSHTHLRDGFVRAIQSRITLAQKSGLITPEEEDALIQPMQTLKGLFPNVSLPKHKPLHAVLTAPDRSTSSRTLYFPELGRLDDSWIANEFFLSYFAGKGISPAMKQSVEEAITEIH